MEYAFGAHQAVGERGQFVEKAGEPLAVEIATSGESVALRLEAEGVFRQHFDAVA